jgi:hypothetical protein
MILGLPWTTWLLLLVAVGAGLAIELVFYRQQRDRIRDPRATDYVEHS